jgi:hypothetical protein
MSAPIRVPLLTIIVALAALLPTASARADGLPVGGLDTTDHGISATDGAAHYYALPAGDRRTELLEVVPSRDVDLRRLDLRGTLAVPGIALDGTTSGLSADGKTLALIEPRRRFPRERTPIALIDTERMKVFDRFALPGDFSFDAISPDGSVLYFIHYLDPRDPGRYEVRAYDTVPGELRQEPVIDRRTAPQVMRGFPLTRTTSSDGAWEFTLYDGAGKTPFVHALNTADGTALCIDLPQLDDVGNLNWVELAPAPDGGAIAVVHRRSPVAEIDTTDWTVSAPATGHDGTATAGGGIPLWWSMPAAALLVLLGLCAWIVRRRRSAAPPEDPLPGLGTDPRGAPRRDEEGERDKAGAHG